MHRGERTQGRDACLMGTLFACKISSSPRQRHPPQHLLLIILERYPNYSADISSGVAWRT